MAGMPKPFTFSRRVQFAETDMAGIAHFSVFFRFMEEAETAFWKSLGLSMILRQGETAVGWPKVRVNCEYHSPVGFDDLLEIDVTVAEIGKHSVRFVFVFRRSEAAADGKEQEVARGEMKVVCVPLKPAGKLSATPIPEPVRKKLENVLSA